MVVSGTPKIRRVHSGSPGFTPTHLGVVVFIRVPAGSLGRALKSSGHSGSRVLTRARLHCGRLVHFSFAWVHSDVNFGRRVVSSSRGFTRSHQGFVVFIRVRVGSLRRA